MKKPRLQKKFKNPFASLRHTRFSMVNLAVFIIVFGSIGSYLIYTSLAATITKTWDTQADLQGGTLISTVATADGHLTLTPSAVSTTYSFQRNLVESGTQVMEGCAAGDINGDGKDDLVLAGDSYLAWYDQPAWTKHVIDTSSTGRGFGAGAETMVYDINGDGRNDVVAGDQATLQELWYENTGTGWVKHVMYSGSKFHNIAFGDFNGNGKIAAIGVDQYSSTKTILLLTPGADITQPWNVTTVATGNYMGMAEGDINGDGKLDFVSGRSWFRNNGGNPATFTRFSFTNMVTSGTDYGGGYTAAYFTDYSEVQLLDLNGDGKLDIFAVIFAESQEGHVYSFTQPADPTQLWTATDVDNGPMYAIHSELAANYDGSGKPQIMVGESNQGGFGFPPKSGGPSSIYMYKLTDGSPDNAANWQKTTIDTIGTHEAALGDFNSDGKPDFTGHFENTTAANAQFHYWINNTTVTSTYPATGTAVYSLDAGADSTFSNLVPTDSQPTGTSISYDLRTSPDNATWSAWTPSASIASLPSGRYLQLRATLSTTDSATTPSIDKLSVDYAGVSAPPVPGDANGDGRVDVTDLSMLLSNYGSTTNTTCDFDGSGKVDIFDLSILLSHYGQ